MKNREEYEASIFAKRDALLEKRKRITAAATSALCIALCFVAAAVFLPKSLNKSNSDLTSTAATTVPSTTLPAAEELVGMGGESGVFDAAGAIENESNEAEAEDVEHFTFNETYTKHVTYPATKKQPASNKYFGYSPEGSSEKDTTAADAAETTEIALETEIYWEDGSRPVAGTQKPGSTPSTTAKPIYNDHAEEKAIEAALGYLTDEQRAKVDSDAHIDVTVTRNADGSEYFTVILHTNEGAYLVSVDSTTFEFVKFSERKNSTQAVSQGYNPNTTTAKPPMIPTTTAAPEYIPN